MCVRVKTRDIGGEGKGFVDTVYRTKINNKAHKENHTDYAFIVCFFLVQSKIVK